MIILICGKCKIFGTQSAWDVHCGVELKLQVALYQKRPSSMQAANWQN